MRLKSADSVDWIEKLHEISKQIAYLFDAMMTNVNEPALVCLPTSKLRNSNFRPLIILDKY